MSRMSKAETVSVIGCGSVFTKKAIALGLTAAEGKCDIAVVGENALHGSVAAEVVFCPEHHGVDLRPECVSAVTAGMGHRATLGFSSIRDGKAVLSVNRRIDFLGNTVEPSEAPVAFDTSMSLYENIVLGFLNNYL